MTITPIWRLLSLPQNTRSDRIAQVLTTRYAVEPSPQLRPYHMVFCGGIEDSDLICRVYDEIVDALETGRDTQIDATAEVGVLALALLGVGSAREKEGPAMTPPLVDQFERAARQQGSSPFPSITVPERWSVVRAWIFVAVVGLGILALLPSLKSHWEARDRSPSAVATQVAKKLREANQSVTTVGECLEELDSRQARWLGSTTPIWHDPDREPLPRPVALRLAPPVDTAAELAVQDAAILRYLGLVRTRAQLAADCTELSRQLNKLAPDYSGAHVKSLLETDRVTSEAKELHRRARALLAAFDSLSKGVSP